MTVVVPEPIPLAMPSGDPVALEEFVEDVAGTAYHLAVVATCLSSSSASTPHWRGADASAAAVQVSAVARLADDLSGAVAAAAHRLRAHHDLLVLVRRRVAALRVQQDEDFVVAWGRLSRIENYPLGAVTGGPEALAVVEDLRAAEVARRREHDRLLEELADDAAAAGRALAGGCRAVGGTGRPDGSGRMVAYLAAQLPGWGDAELRRRGADLAGQLLGLLSAEERESSARAAAAYAGSTAFAGSFLAGLGEGGVRELLTVLGDGDLGPASALAATLGRALGAAVPTGSDRDAVGDALSATYIDPNDVGTHPDLVALGMGIVLHAGGVAGPRPETVVNWGRQMLERERVQGQGLTGARAVDRAAPIGQTVEPTDPMETVVDRLTRSDALSSAADFLSERSTWDVLLSRPWDDGAIALVRLVDHVGTAGSPVGGDAARAGLEALGAGLDDGDPDEWTVDRETAAAVAESLGVAVAAHVSLIAGALERAADGHLGPRDGDALRGLGYLTLDEGAARAVAGSLQIWAGVRPSAVGAPSPSQLVAVPSAFVAVREYGQRLAHALHGFEQQAAAALRKRRWDGTVGLLAEVTKGPAGAGAGLAEGYGAILLDCDGTFEVGKDEGRVFGRVDAVAAVLGDGALGAREPAESAVAARAGAVYENTLDALGRPKPPTSEPEDWAGPLRDAVFDLAVERLDGRGRGVRTESRIGRWFLGGGEQVTYSRTHGFTP